MKSIFLFGAGASREAGAPLMSDFLDKAHDLIRLKTPGVMEAKADFENVFDAISELQGVHSKSYLDLDNIEIVFGAIEMAVLLNRLGTRDKASISELRKALITVIYKTLEFSIPFSLVDEQILPPKPYNSFVKVLSDVISKQPHQDPHQFSFLTFNYDLCLDYALHFSGIGFDYCLTSEKTNRNPLLKLHGSINWGLSNTKEIIPYGVHEAHFETYHAPRNVFFNLGSTLKHKKHHDTLLEGPPVIVPPTWNKNSYHGQISNVWSRAAAEFSQAENIFIVGYSLPETDSFFRYLFALGTESTTRLRHIMVINPDKTAEERFRQLIGRGIAGRFQFEPFTFTQGIGKIKEVLENP